MTTQNLLVELFVEELPPKALQKLGDAFAGVLFDQLKAQGLTSATTRPSPPTPRRAAWPRTSAMCWLKAEDKAVSQKLMPVAVGLTPRASPRPRC
jgi:glycyl-tRNA synthetase beta chain